MEVKGRKVKLSIWVRYFFFSLCVERNAENEKCSPLPPWTTGVGHTYRTRQVKNASALSRRRTIVVHRASSSVCLFPAPLLPVSPSAHDFYILTGACSLARSLCGVVSTVYDVSSRESFDALPRWLSELDTYVSPEVVKIVVGNKLDKVK